jgi:hypothetical protein
MTAEQTLAQLVRAKYPGAYDDMTDQQLEQSVRAKFPGVYDDIPTTPATPAAAPRGPQHPHAKVDTASNLLRGAASMFPGVRYTPADAAKVSMATQPTNTGERVGRFVEKTAELAMPAARVARATQGMGVIPRAGAQSLTSGTVSAAQGASPTEVATSAAIGGVASGTADAVSAAVRGVTQIFPEKLYAQIFRYANDDLMKAYRNVAKGRPAQPALAKQMLERGVMGSSDDMAVYSLQKLDSLESQLQQAVARKVLVLPKKAEYVAQLDDLAKRFSGGFFSERGAEAAALRDSLAKMPGPSARASDMLRIKRFLDGMRTSSSFRLDPTLTAKQEELKVAADLIRSTLHKQPQLSTLINEERIFIEAVDSIVGDAVRRGNRSVFGIVDAALSSAGPKGAAAAAMVRGAQLPKAITGLAQALYRGGQRVSDPAGAVRTAGAAASGAGR